MSSHNFSIPLSPAELPPNALDYLEEALHTGWLAPSGPLVREFEKKMAQFCQRKRAVATSTGTAAIHLALAALNIGRGDEVICPDFSYVASVNPVLYTGAKPVLVGAEKESWGMDPEAVVEAIQQRKDKTGTCPKAVIVTHVYGIPAQMDQLLEIADRYEIPVIEDAAEGVGASFKNKPLGSMGSFSILSFNGNKLMSTTGGGLCLFDDLEKESELRNLIRHAKDDSEPAEFSHRSLGYNYQFSNILAALGLSQLEDLPRQLERKKEIYHRYKKGLAGYNQINWMPEPVKGENNFWLSCAVLDDEKIKHKLQQYLRKAGIETRSLWKPMHMQEHLKTYPVYKPMLGEQLWKRGLALPSGTGLTEDEQGFIIDQIRTVLETY